MAPVKTMARMAPHASMAAMMNVSSPSSETRSSRGSCRRRRRSRRCPRGRPGCRPRQIGRRGSHAAARPWPEIEGVRGGSGGGSATGTLGRLRESGFQTDVKPAGRTRGGDELGRTWRSSDLPCTIGRACTIARTEKSARSTAATLHERVIAPGGARDFPIRRVGADPQVLSRAERGPRDSRRAARGSFSVLRPRAHATTSAALDPIAEDEAFLRTRARSGRREQEAQARRGPLRPPALRSRLVCHLERQLPSRATAQGPRQELVLRVRRGERPGRDLPPETWLPAAGPDRCARPRTAPARPVHDVGTHHPTPSFKSGHP